MSSLVRVLILAAGDGTRWKEFRGTKKHKAIVENEVLIERTVRQFSKYSSEIFIVSNDKLDKIKGTRGYSPTKTYNFKDMDKFWSSKDIWSKHRTVLVFGDVYFTDKAVEVIMKDKEEVTFFLRSTKSKTTGKPWGEIFCMAFNSSFSNRLKESILELVKSGVAVSAGGWWLLYALRKKHNNIFSIEIDDWTEDFDFPWDLDRWEVMRKQSLIEP
jgi:hypothetical protein